MSDEYVTVARIGEVAPGTGKAIVIDSREIALFNVDGRFYALDNTCPHQGGPLADGWVEGGHVTCPWHAWTFRLTDGRMTLGDYARVAAYDVRIDGDAVLVSRTPRPV